MLKIPKGFLQKLLTDRQVFKAVIVYLELKPLFYDGRFKLFFDNLESIAEYLEMHPKTLLYKLELLQELDLIDVSRKRNEMKLASWERFHEVFGEENKSGRYKFYRLKNSVNVELAIRQLVIEENLSAQERAIEIKLFKSELLEKREARLLKQFKEIQQSKLIPAEDKERQLNKLIIEMRSIKLRFRDLNKDKEFKKWKRSGRLDNLLKAAWQNYDNHLQSFNTKHPVNLDISISCRGVARLFGLKSSSSGHYWERILEAKEQVKIHNRSVKMHKLTGAHLHFEKKHENMELHYYEGRKGCYRRLNNLLMFTPLATV